VVENSTLAPLADPNGAASTFAAETVGAGAPDPCTLVKAKRSLNWPPWEKLTKRPVTCKACPVVQGLSQMGSININNPKPFPMPTDHQVPLSIDSTPVTTAESHIMHDVPHRKAIITPTWAALATCSDTISTATTVAYFAVKPRPAHLEAAKGSPHYPSHTCGLPFTYGDASSPLEGNAHADNSTAVDQCATSGHTFPIDGGTTPLFSKRQETAFLPTTSKHITATHSGKEALHPCSPVSCTLGDPKAPAPPLLINHAAIAFTCDHQHHPPDPLGHQEVEPPGSHAADNMVADAPMPLLPTKVKHFAMSPGPCTK